MVEEFKWRVERDVDPTINYRVIETKFGDGYAQTSTEGINTKDEQYVIKVHGNESEVKTIMAFFDRHAGWKSFLWRPPLGNLGLYRCVNPKPKPEGGGLYSVTGTFVKGFASTSQ